MLLKNRLSTSPVKSKRVAPPFYGNIGISWGDIPGYVIV